MNLDMLREKLKEKDVNVDTLAAIVGINRASMYRKLNKFEKITIGEASKIKTALELSDEDAFHIFLAS